MVACPFIIAPALFNHRGRNNRPDGLDLSPN
jgi:hypothetical protein